MYMNFVNHMKCVILITACPIKGQVRLECARHPSCHGRCNRNDNNTICPLVCIVNGCECPNGTIIDDVKKECVAPNNCTGTHNYKYHL